MEEEASENVLDRIPKRACFPSCTATRIKGLHDDLEKRMKDNDSFAVYSTDYKVSLKYAKRDLGQKVMKSSTLLLDRRRF